MNTITGRHLIGVVMICAGLAGCTVKLTKDTLTETLQGYSDAQGQGVEPGIVELGTSDWAYINGDNLADEIMIGFRGDTKTPHGSVSLLAGKYSVKWGRVFSISILIDPRMKAEWLITQSFHVEPGHTYRLQSTRSTGHGYQAYFWVEDVTTGDFIYEGCQSDKGEGVTTTLASAEAGDAAAQLQMALWYEGSRCFNQRYKQESDYAKARTWFERAANAGNAEAQYKLAEIYRNGKGTPVDLARAFDWYQKAAEAGDDYAAYQVGVFYHKGLHVEQDMKMAREWYERAAEKGHYSAKSALKKLDNES